VTSRHGANELNAHEVYEKSVSCQQLSKRLRSFTRAVIIAARGVTLSNFLSGLLETDAIVLHCDERHQACGWRFLRVFGSLR
jgi:hypothetical protein